MVSKDGRGVVSEVEDGSRKSVGDNGMGYDTMVVLMKPYQLSIKDITMLIIINTILVVY